MTAGTFGRKGIGAPAQRRTGIVAGEPRSFQPVRREQPAGDDVDVRRAAFLAGERARKEQTEVELPPAEPLTGPRSLPLAYGLWLTLGLLGAHRFYLGRSATGALLAMLTVAGGSIVATEHYEAFGAALVSAVWVFVDGFLIRDMHRKATGGA